MVLFMILMVIIAAAMLCVLPVIFTGGLAFLAVFGDLIVFGIIIAAIVKYLVGKKK